MNGGRTVFLTVLCGLLLGVIAHETSHALSDWALHFALGGLPIAFAALRLEFRDAWKTVVLLGLFADSLAPISFGVHAFLYLVATVFIYRIRHRLAREEPMVGVLFAILANVFVHAGLCAIYLWRGPDPLGMIPRLLTEWGLNALLVALLGPWFFSLCDHALGFFGIDLRREQRGFH